VNRAYDPAPEARSAEETRALVLFLAPMAAVLGAFVVLPVLGTLATSLYQDVSYLPHRFAGAANFQALVSDPGFWRAAGFTLLFTLVSVPLELAAGLAVALALNQPGRLRPVLRASILLPWAFPAAVSGRVWQLIYNYAYGAANGILAGFGLIDGPVNWLGTGPSAFLALLAADLWKTTPFAAIILLAGLAGIPGDVYLQAQVDRTSAWQRFTRITLPLLKPVLTVALVLRAIDALRLFDLVYVITGGGPGGATTTISVLAYTYMAGGDLGYGAAASVLLFAAALALSIAVLRLSRFEGGGV
jgi:multiple sugar transport system permease protein